MQFALYNTIFIYLNITVLQTSHSWQNPIPKDMQANPNVNIQIYSQTESVPDWIKRDISKKTLLTAPHLKLFLHLCAHFWSWRLRTHREMTVARDLSNR